ncbi:MAG: hypothetical protein LQ338_007045 [Usnochroma carphineum]|nr:MAG: hypothetical protein LQ338_007045 [Usnochroma carphineum]
MASDSVHRRRPRDHPDNQSENDGSPQRERGNLEDSIVQLFNKNMDLLKRAPSAATNVIQQVNLQPWSLERRTQGSQQGTEGRSRADPHRIEGQSASSLGVWERLLRPVHLVAVLLLLLLWVILALVNDNSGTLEPPPPLGNITQASWQARLLTNDAIIRTKGGRVPLEKLAQAADILRVLESTVFNSSDAIQARLLGPIHEAGLGFNRTSQSLQALHYSLVGYNESWPYHLASLHQDLADEKAAARALPQRLWNAATKHLAPSWYYNTDVVMQKRILSFSKNLGRDLDRIESTAQEYNRNVTVWTKALARIDEEVGHALVNYCGRKRETAGRFTSVYLGLNRQEANQMDEYIRQILRVDESVREATDNVMDIQQESSNAAADLKAINERLADWINECKSGPRCHGLQDELRALDARVQKLGPAYTL